MEISEVRVRLIPNRNNEDRLRAFCSVTFDGEFVIRDLKLIEGTNGVFVAMPSRKLADHCSRCGAKNHLRARFCNECGAKLNRARIRRDSENRPKYHADVAHPINSACRERIEAAVRQAYADELERAKQPGYQPPVLDDDDDGASDYDDLIAELKRDATKRRPPSEAGEEAETDVSRVPHTALPDDVPEPKAREAWSPDPPRPPRNESSAHAPQQNTDFGAGLL